ncbi:DUF4760 domain-containing protein, partial [Pseudomonas aeruginosa]
MCSAIIEFLASELFRNLLVLTGVIVAIVSVLSAKATAKRKQTADLMFGTRSDQELSKGYRRKRTGIT